ncbi:hypothetical protein ACDH53_25810 [Pseudomonas tremae]|uniref:Uncharacterized protein n=1 Tax=Pseudomonas tremae TaxID=200454 RepID=A0ABV4PLA4_9PSED
MDRKLAVQRMETFVQPTSIRLLLIKLVVLGLLSFCAALCWNILPRKTGEIAAFISVGMMLAMLWVVATTAILAVKRNWDGYRKFERALNGVTESDLVRSRSSPEFNLLEQRAMTRCLNSRFPGWSLDKNL